MRYQHAVSERDALLAEKMSTSVEPVGNVLPLRQPRVSLG
jgi:hypothetical protein